MTGFNQIKRRICFFVHMGFSVFESYVCTDETGLVIGMFKILFDFIFNHFTA